MATPRLARISRSLLKSSTLSSEGNPILRCLTAGASVPSEELGQLRGHVDPSHVEGVRSRPRGAAAVSTAGASVPSEHLGQLGGLIDQSHAEGIRSTPRGAANVFSQYKCGLNDGNGPEVGSLWRFVAVSPSMEAKLYPKNAKVLNSLRKFSTTRSLGAGGSAMKVKTLDHVVLTVKDIEDTCRFYADVLGMEVAKFSASDGGTRVALAFGEQKINLHQVGKEFEPKAHRATAGSADLCFITDAPLDEMQKHIESNRVTILQGPVGRQGALGAIRSVYFRDPDLNLIEVSNYLNVDPSVE